MPTTGWLTLEDRLLAPIGGAGLDMTTLARTVCDAIALHVPYDFACLALMDPTSGVGTWAYKTRDLGIGDEEFSASEYGGPDINKFEDIARRRPPVGALSVDTDGHPETCLRHRDFMAPRLGFTDELRAVFTSRAASWGAIGIYRGPGDPPFTQAEADQLGSICDLVADAIQRSLFRQTPGSIGSLGGSPATGPAVLIVDADDRRTHVSPAAHSAFEALGGLQHGSLPASVQAVVARTRARREPFETRTQLEDGRWLSLRAAPLDGPDGPADGERGTPDVVVTLEPTPRSVLSRLALTAHGLTTREEDVAVLVLQGVDTQGIAASLHLSPHTVQDHLKSIFTKLGVRSRREMTARLTRD